MAANQKVMLYKAVSGSEFPEDFNIRFHTHMYCQRGSVKFLFNGQQYESKKGEFIFWLAGIDVSDLSFSKNFKATVLFVDSDLLTASLPSATTSIDSII
ncbi:MAG: AraC family transcriptional regulator, partial [Chitinophagaceae bacterium]